MPRSEAEVREKEQQECQSGWGGLGERRRARRVGQSEAGGRARGHLKAI